MHTHKHRVRLMKLKSQNNKNILFNLPSNCTPNDLTMSKNVIKIMLTTIKSSAAPMTRTRVDGFGTDATGSDTLSFFRSNNGSLELSVINS
ncbi:hypothetical protein Hanom_Chr15g01372821 [Helianthus anomalus]